MSRNLLQYFHKKPHTIRNNEENKRTEKTENRKNGRKQPQLQAVFVQPFFDFFIAGAWTTGRGFLALLFVYSQHKNRGVGTIGGGGLVLRGSALSHQ